MRRPLLLALLLAATACAPTVSRPQASRAPLAALPAAPRPQPAPALAVDWREWPVSPGTWTYARDERGSVAAFGQSGAGALALLRCDLPNRRVFVSRSGAAAAPLTVRTTSIARQLPVGATGGDPAYVAAVLPASDALLDAMAFSRGRFTLEQAGAAPLVLPPWAEIGRVIEDCRG